MTPLSRVFVADPDATRRTAVTTWVGRTGRRVHGTAGTVPGARVALGSTSPDVAIVSLDLPGPVPELIAELARVRRIPTVVTGDDPTARRAVDAVVAGASGFLGYGNLDGRGEDCLRAVLDGVPSYPPQLVSALVAELTHLQAEAARRRRGDHHLTEREWDVLELLRRGCSTKEIAGELGIAPVTVRTHIAAVMHRFHVATRRDLLEAARRPAGQTLRDLNTQPTFGQGDDGGALLASAPSGP